MYHGGTAATRDLYIVRSSQHPATGEASAKSFNRPDSISPWAPTATSDDLPNSSLDSETINRDTPVCPDGSYQYDRFFGG